MDFSLAYMILIFMKMMMSKQSFLFTAVLVYNLMGGGGGLKWGTGTLTTSSNGKIHSSSLIK